MVSLHEVRIPPESGKLLGFFVEPAGLVLGTPVSLEGSGRRREMISFEIIGGVKKKSFNV